MARAGHRTQPSLGKCPLSLPVPGSLTHTPQDPAGLSLRGQDHRKRPILAAGTRWGLHRGRWTPTLSPPAWSPAHAQMMVTNGKRAVLAPKDLTADWDEGSSRTELPTRLAPPPPHVTAGSPARDALLPHLGPAASGTGLQSAALILPGENVQRGVRRALRFPHSSGTDGEGPFQCSGGTAGGRRQRKGLPMVKAGTT